MSFFTLNRYMVRIEQSIIGLIEDLIVDTVQLHAETCNISLCVLWDLSFRIKL
jgi:hypothetical protein